MAGVVVIGEGEKDEAPMLFNGEQVGNGAGPGRSTSRSTRWRARALTALGHAERHRVVARLRTGHDVLPRRGRVHGQDRRRARGRGRHGHRGARPPRTSAASRRRKGVRAEEVTVVVLDRERHQRLIADLREAGARVMLITDGDVAPAIAAA